MDLISLLTAFGFGSVATVILQAIVSTREKIADRKFQLKHEAYIGFLDAYKTHVVSNTKTTAREVGYWRIRIELVCSDEVKAALATLFADDGDPQAIDQLAIPMRMDLGI